MAVGKGKNKGNFTAQLNLRVRKISVLLEDLEWHLSGRDIQHDRKLKKNKPSLIEAIPEFRQRLELMRKMEHFLTVLIRDRVNLFENSLSTLEMPPKGELNLVEQNFMQFNYILGGGDPRKLLPENVQFGVDLELMLDIMESRFGVSELRTTDELAKRATQAFIPRQSNRANRQRRADTISDQSRKEEEDRDFDQLEIKRLPVSRDRLSLEARQDLCDFSYRLRNNLSLKKHIDLRRMINSNTREKHKGACNYINSLFTQYEELTFVAVNLCFDRESNYLDCHDQLEAFKNKVRHYSPLGDMVGFIGKWEFTPIKGLYVRIICIFKKAEASLERQLLSLIGNYWQYDVTNGSGSFHGTHLSSNPDLLKNHICTISASDKKEIKLFKDRVILYLTYSQEYYRYKFNKNFKQELKEYERGSKKKAQNDSEMVSQNNPDGDSQSKPERKPSKSSGRYKVLPNNKDDEPHNIFFKGETKKRKSKKSNVKDDIESNAQ